MYWVKEKHNVLQRKNKAGVLPPLCACVSLNNHVAPTFYLMTGIWRSAQCLSFFAHVLSHISFQKVTRCYVAVEPFLPHKT